MLGSFRSRGETRVYAVALIALTLYFATGAFPYMSDSVSKDDEDTILALKFLQKWDGSVRVSKAPMRINLVRQL